MKILKRILAISLFVFVTTTFATVSSAVRNATNGVPPGWDNSTYAYRFHDLEQGLDDASQTASQTLPSDPQIEKAKSKVSPAVVSIFGYANAQPQSTDSPLSGFWNLALPSTQRQQMNAGTAFFVDSSGYLLTSDHVVSDPTLTYAVTLSNGTQKDVTILYEDKKTDVAVLKIDGVNYPTLKLGDSSKLRMGQKVLGMGNAFGKFTNLTSVGNVSAFNQDIIASDSSAQNAKLSNLFQTSMQLYPGDSGGPTFDLNGNVVGINNAIAVTVGNMSFSVPINAAKSALIKAVPSYSTSRGK